MSGKVRFILMSVALILVAVLCWFFLLSPLRGQIAQTEEDIEDQRQQLTIAQTQLAQAEGTKQEGRRNQARLLELNKMVPPSEEIPSLLLQLQDLADQSGIDFMALTPGQPKVSDAGSAYEILPLDLQFSGTYFDVSDFIYRAEQMVAGPGRLLTIKTLGFGAGGTQAESGVAPLLEVSMSLYAFVQSEAPAPAAPVAPAASTDDGED